MEFVDTHCHIHFPDYGLDTNEVITEAANNGVTRMLAVGCTLPDSKLAVDFAAKYDNIWASIGLHPHEAAHYVCDEPSCLAAQQPAPPSLLAHRGVENSSAPSQYSRYSSVRPSSSPSAASKHKHNESLTEFVALVKQKKVVAIGETGLDYHYMHSPKKDQQKLFRFQLDMAVEHDLPLVFHVREAFEDFWHILDSYKGLRGVVHSFSSDRHDLDEILSRGFYVGLNGIMTFTKNRGQLEAAKAVPLEKLLLETDAPFLTPVPFRGKICQPKHVRVTAEFMAELRGETLEKLAELTSANAKELFNLS